MMLDEYKNIRQSTGRLGASPIKGAKTKRPSFASVSLSVANRLKGNWNMQVRSLSGAPINISMKNIIIFGMVRTGTTYIHHLVSYYMLLKYPNRYTIFDEFFNTTLQELVPCDDTKKFKYIRLHDSSSTKETENRVSNYLINKPIITKLHSDDTINFKSKTELYEHLNKTSKFIITERDDMLDIVLSYALAQHTDTWNVTNKKDLTYPQIEISKDMFLEILQWKKEHDTLKQYFLDIIGVVNYTDIQEQNHTSILRRLGFNDKETFSKMDNFGVPVKLLTKEQKLNLITNLNDALNWHDEIFGSYKSE